MDAERIPWDATENEQGVPYLLAEGLTPHVNVGLRFGPDDDFEIQFGLRINGKRCSLPEVEDFVRRCVAFLENEPVVP